MFYRLITIAVIRFERLEKNQNRDIDNKILSDFSKFLTNEKYSESTVKKMIGRVKFFCTRAKDFGIEVNENYTQTVFIAESEEEYKYPYLNVKEVNKVFKLDLRHDDLLDNVRDNFIIGLWTGLRVSDF
jgi:site-specific recombinase XerD